MLTRVAFKSWLNNFDIKRDLFVQAKRYNEEILVQRTLLVWRIQLRVKLQMSKVAKTARKERLILSHWSKWRAKLDEKKREEKMRTIDLHVVKRNFDSE